ncbi:tetratricopeptide repeat protein [Amycolatopsis lurida]
MTEPEQDRLAPAKTWLEQGRYDRALAELDRFRWRDEVDSTYLRALALWLNDQDADAVKAASAGIRRFGPHAPLLSVLGQAYHSLGKLPKAERALLDALALSPDDTHLLCAYARVCIDAGQLRKAADLLDRAAPAADVTRRTRDLLLRAKAADEEEQRVERHPLLRPLAPLNRFGPIKTWIGVIVLIFCLRMLGLTPLAVLLGVAWFAYALYSWFAPTLVRRLVRRKLGH